MQARGADVAGADGHLTAEEAVDVVVEALREERFHVLPHPEVEEYVRIGVLFFHQELKALRPDSPQVH